MLRPADILKGAMTPEHPNVAVVGAYDQRITFYSQQVRGLELAWALKTDGRLRPGMQCVVVGAGAAGLAVAAGLGLLEEVEVVVMDAADQILQLQSASVRRKLDPRIYEWPGLNTADPVAGLPILDWEAGSARSVRADVKDSFDAVVQACGGRLAVKTRRLVTSATPVDARLALTYEDHANDGTCTAGQMSCDLLILAIGFGVETHPDAYVDMPSYWSDAGVPGPELQARQTPRFVVSGDGDGALIDLVAAGSADFDHAAMIRLITDRSGIETIFPALAEIDQEARDAAEAKTPYDFTAAYDARILAPLQALDLPGRITEALRPGVHLTLQTLDPMPFNVRTATLNRLAAWLVSKACADRFQHLVGSLDLIDAPNPAPYAANCWFSCGGAVFGVHTTIVRHGPGRTAIRAPFDNLLTGFKEAHDDWLDRYGDKVRVPRLSAEAARAIAERPLYSALPTAAWRRRLAAAAEPRRVAVQVAPGGFAWSGDLAIANCARIWGDPGRMASIYVTATPQQLPQTAAALLRLAVHGRHTELKGDVGLWRAYAEVRTEQSNHAQHMTLPNLSAGVPMGVDANVTQGDDAVLAACINGALNLALLDQIHACLQTYITTRYDLGSRVMITPPADLANAMDTVWTSWHRQFQLSPPLLDHFLRLLVCAPDTPAAVEEARILLGPLKIDRLIRGTMIAVMIAAGWTQLNPVGVAPGNLALDRATGPWSGHACGADMIDGRPLAVKAAQHVWRTHFVVLPMMDTPVEVARTAEDSLTDVGGGLTTLVDPGQPNFFLAVDSGFRTAAEQGLDALADYLGDVEDAHFQKLRDTVEP